jgi:DNA-binding Lrp family transcriptional regulator
MARSPYFPFYPGDWLRNDVSGCSLEAQGLWLRMMIVMHDAQVYGQLILNNEPMPMSFLAKKCGISPRKLGVLLAELDQAGVINRKENGVIYSGRMERDERERQQNRARQKEHYDKTHGKPNGEPNADLTEKNGEPNGKPNTPSSSSSSSSSSKPPTPKGKDGVAVATKPEAELFTWLNAVAIALGAKDAAALPKFKTWRSVCLTAIREDRSLDKLLKIIESEKERTRGKEEFFSAETCLQKLQLNGSNGQPKKWDHDL